MAGPELVIGSADAPLASCVPQLMPFHIDYSGPAPISTFFRVKDAPPDSCGAPSSSSHNRPWKKRFTSAFRGRIIQGLEMRLPDGYGGIVLGAGGMKNSINGSVDRKLPKRTGKNGKGRSTRRTRSSKIPIDEIEEEQKNEDDDLDQLDQQPLNGVGEIKLLKPTHAFSSLVIWNPDIAVDEGSDEYIRALNEWTALASEVSLVFYLLFTYINFQFSRVRFIFLKTNHVLVLLCYVILTCIHYLCWEQHLLTSGCNIKTLQGLGENRYVFHDCSVSL